MVFSKAFKDCMSEAGGGNKQQNFIRGTNFSLETMH